MSTHNIQIHDKRRKFPKIFVFWSYWKNLVGTQKQVRISHGNRAISVRAMRFDCIWPCWDLNLRLLDLQSDVLLAALWSLAYVRYGKEFYFIVSGEISVYLVKIKVVSITSELISYHFTIVTDTIYIFTPCFGRLRFSSLFQKWILPPLQIFEHSNFFVS